MSESVNSYYWFEESRKEIRHAFGKDFDVFCRLLAATSPLSTIESNLAIACRAYRCWKLDGFIPRGSFIHTHWVLLQKFLNGTMDSDDLTYKKWRKYTGGRKVWSLYQNLIGNEEVCPIDRWILRYFGYPGDHRILVTEYDEMEQKIKDEAHKLGITPAQRQCQIWCEQRESSTSYADLIKKKRITAENIINRLI